VGERNKNRLGVDAQENLSAAVVIIDWWRPCEGEEAPMCDITRRGLITLLGGVYSTGTQRGVSIGKREAGDKTIELPAPISFCAPKSLSRARAMVLHSRPSPMGSRRSRARKTATSGPYPILRPRAALPSSSGTENESWKIKRAQPWISISASRAPLLEYGAQTTTRFCASSSRP
jgi:hypothetical protein